MAYQLCWIERPALLREGHPDMNRGNLHNQVCLTADFFIAMTYCLYIIYSPFLDQFYIGHSQDIDDRIFRHNNSGSKATKKSNDWKLVYTEIFNTKAEAMRRELEIKRKKSRKYIEWLISSVG